MDKLATENPSNAIQKSINLTNVYGKGQINHNPSTNIDKVNTQSYTVDYLYNL